MKIRIKYLMTVIAVIAFMVILCIGTSAFSYTIDENGVPTFTINPKEYIYICETIDCGSQCEGPRPHQMGNPLTRENGIIFYNIMDYCPMNIEYAINFENTMKNYVECYFQECALCEEDSAIRVIKSKGYDSREDYDTVENDYYDNALLFRVKTVQMNQSTSTGDYTIDDLNNARTNGYNEGRTAGYDEGYEEGVESTESRLESQIEQQYDLGVQAGKDYQTPISYEEGYTAGNIYGYTRGRSEGYETGKSEGDEVGFERGKQYALDNLMGQAVTDSYDEGYKSGYESVVQTDDGSAVSGLFAGLFSGLYDGYNIIADGVSISGISLRAVITTVILLVFAFFIIKFLIGIIKG